MSASPWLTEPNVHPRQAVPATDPHQERIDQLEDEVVELRDTVARFADLMIGQVKDLRKSQEEIPAPVPASAAILGKGRRPWLLVGMLHDFETVIRMYFDPRYRIRRSTKLMVPLILLLFAANCVFFNLVFDVPIVSSAIEKIADVVLTILLYKILSREIERYRQVLAQLAAWQVDRVYSTAVLVNGEPPATRQEME